MANEQLFLQVDASTELLKRSMATNEGTLGHFEGATEAMALSVGRTIARMGDAFGPFQVKAESAATRLKRSFETNFSEIAKIAARAIDGPRTKSGGLSVGADEARAAATAARDRAQAMGLIEQAAIRAAGGEAALNRETAQYLQAARTATIAAEAHAKELAREAGALERLQIELDQTSGAQRRQATQSTVVATSAGQQRAAMQQLSFQLNDVAVGFAAGTPPMVIFAQQSGQVVQALGLMTNGTKGLLGFLGGPWGLALSSALVVLTPFVAKLFEADEAAKAAKLGANGLSDAQSALGGIFDLTSGKLEHQNELLRINARLTAANLRAQAIADETTSSRTFRDAGVRSRAADAANAIGNSFVSSLTNAPPSPFNDRVDFAGLLGLTTGNNAVRGLADRATRANGIKDQAARTRAFEKLISDSERTDFAGSGVDGAAFREAIGKAVSARDQRRAADLIDQSLDTGVLAQGLRRDPPKTRPKKGPSAESIRQRELSEDIAFAEQERTARRQLLDATRKSTGSEIERDKLLREDIEAEAATQRTKIDLREQKGQLSKAEADRLRALTEATRKQRQLNVDADAAMRIVQRRYDTLASALEAELTMLRLQQTLATTQADRARIAADILKLEQQQRRQALERVRDTSQDPEEVQRANAALARLPAVEASEQKINKGENAGILERYGKDLADRVGDWNEAIDSVTVNALQNLEDGLVGIIDGTESVGSAFKKMAASIISDLARIAIQKAILNAVGSSFFGLKDGGPIPGYAGGGSPGGLITGPGSGTSDSILALLGGGGGIRVSNREFIVNAEATKRFLPLLLAINGGRLPGFAAGGPVAPAMPSLTLPAIPSLASGGGAAGVMTVRLMLNDGLLDARIDNRAAGVAVEVVRQTAPGIVRAATDNTMAELSRPGI